MFAGVLDTPLELAVSLIPDNRANLSMYSRNEQQKRNTLEKLGISAIMFIIL